ncbi:MAG: signal peptidase I [Planctomycetes bacterium]|nr:signal peptidase I [Planctomycetota bacterium]
MPKNKTKKTASEEEPKKDIVTQVVDTFDSLITAFILALLFITFVMQVFIIPTGSMAETLKGAHFRLRCQQCGFRYHYGFKPGVYGLPRNTIPRAKVVPPPTRCPSCGHYQSTVSATPITKGDKILVLKSIYQFFQPKRWDVIVFWFPSDPSEKYIKRLIALPGEKLEIIDGDIYIDGLIARKPPKVQKEMWMPVYDNDYQPARPREGSFNGHFWQQPFKNESDSKWVIQKESPAKFLLNTSDGQINTLVYDPSLGNDFKATYAYNSFRGYSRRPYCSDLMTRLYVQPADQKSTIGIALGKYQTLYRAWVDFDGRMVIAKLSDNEERILAQKQIEPPAINEPISLAFTNVDHQLIFGLGNEKLTYDLGRAPEDAGARNMQIPPQVKIFGSGKLILSHVAVFRDTHYTKAEFSVGPKPATAVEGNPITLSEDEFFVLGDNSSDSLDSRLWNQPGKGNRNTTYRQAVVPREYLVGKALVVFWPSGFKPFEKFPFACIPDVSQMKFIYGGSKKEL